MLSPQERERIYQMAMQQIKVEREQAKFECMLLCGHTLYPALGVRLAG
jgi:hypothetical protein